MLVYYLIIKDLKFQCSSNSFMYYVLLHPWVMMLGIITTPCCYMACHIIIMGNQVVNHKNQWYFQLSDKWISWKLVSQVKMLIIIAKFYCHVACHVIVMGDWIIISHKGQWYFWLTNSMSQIYINTIWKIMICFTTKIN